MNRAIAPYLPVLLRQGRDLVAELQKHLSQLAEVIPQQNDRHQLPGRYHDQSE